ncbi:polysaccharide biosynthesis/export family protein [candidate division KSB1 bacterium]|nr:polysaccharide biosynthesis/export family protein [candidate division KSB1 bacterium]
MKTSYMTKALLSAVVVGLLTSSMQAQQYVIQLGDRLDVSFWQEPGLNTVVTVGSDGKIDLPVLGRIRAAGLTTSQFSEKIVEQISRYRINITQASVVVVEYKGNKIYVTGQVGSPGTYSFESIPDLWRVLQEAGGLLETADLSRVTLITAEGKTGKITRVDLNSYFQEGEVSRLPELHGGETIYVPTRPSVRAGADAPSSPFSSRKEVYIFGEVASPGRYNLEEDVNIVDALVLAGGPTPSAKLSEVKVLKRWAGGTSIVKIDLQKYLTRAEPRPFLLMPGDTIFVPRKREAMSFIFTTILLPVFTAVSVLLVVQAIR